MQSIFSVCRTDENILIVILHINGILNRIRSVIGSLIPQVV